ncbi:MAG: hypothetical protein SPL47_01550 [Bacteroidales bacterium]|nr:hypothetical protein [Bacteroidales bacterium]
MKEYNDNSQFEEIIRSLEAERLTDSEPLQKPNMLLAQSQLKSTVKGKSNKRKPWMYMAAASVALAVGVALFFVLKNANSSEDFVHNTNEKNIVQDKNDIDIEAKRSNTVKYAERSPINISSQKNAEKPIEQEDVPLQASKLEKNYATMEVISHIEMISPNKENYNILCKNLDKVFTFKWKSENVKSQVFTIKDSHGNVIVETSNATHNKYEMPYKKVYPGKKLHWELIVVHEDGIKTTKKGTINITYEL